MFLKRKKHAWYWGVVVLFFMLRMFFRFARFFLKAADKQAAWSEKKRARAMNARRQV